MLHLPVASATLKSALFAAKQSASARGNPALDWELAIQSQK